MRQYFKKKSIKFDTHHIRNVLEQKEIEPKNTHYVSSTALYRILNGSPNVYRKVFDKKKTDYQFEPSWNSVNRKEIPRICLRTVIISRRILGFRQINIHTYIIFRPTNSCMNKYPEYYVTSQSHVMYMKPSNTLLGP